MLGRILGFYGAFVKSHHFREDFPTNPTKESCTLGLTNWLTC